MAKYHLTAEKIRKDYALGKEFTPNMESVFNNIHLELLLDCMRGCSQLRQSKVIESFFKEIFPNVKTEFIEIDGKYGKFQNVKVIE